MEAAPVGVRADRAVRVEDDPVPLPARPAAGDDGVEVFGHQRGRSEEQSTLDGQPRRRRGFVGGGRRGLDVLDRFDGLGAVRSCCHAVRPSSGRVYEPILGHTGPPDDTTYPPSINWGTRRWPASAASGVVAHGGGQRAHRLDRFPAVQLDPVADGIVAQVGGHPPLGDEQPWPGERAAQAGRVGDLGRGVVGGRRDPPLREARGPRGERFGVEAGEDERDRPVQQRAGAARQHLRHRREHGRAGERHDGGAAGVRGDRARGNGKPDGVGPGRGEQPPVGGGAVGRAGQRDRREHPGAAGELGVQHVTGPRCAGDGDDHRQGARALAGVEGEPRGRAGARDRDPGQRRAARVDLGRHGRWQGGGGHDPGHGSRLRRDGEDAGGRVRLDLQRGLQPAGVAADRGERVRGGGVAVPVDGRDAREAQHLQPQHGGEHDGDGRGRSRNAMRVPSRGWARPRSALGAAPPHRPRQQHDDDRPARRQHDRRHRHGPDLRRHRAERRRVPARHERPHVLPGEHQPAHDRRAGEPGDAPPPRGRRVAQCPRGRVGRRRRAPG